MNVQLLILLAVVSGSYGFYVNVHSMFQNTRNISCAFAANLSLSPSMVPGSLWSTIGSFASAWSIYGNISSIVTNFGNNPSVWKVDGRLSLPNIFDFCFIEVINSTSPNGTSSISTVAGGYFGINVLEQYVKTQCTSANFSPLVTPIGYGTCNPIPYLMFTSTLCICSTNNCNINYTTCMTSVQANQSPPPPNLPILIPTVQSAISCQTNIQGGTYDKYATIYNLLTMANLLYNITGVLGYRSSISAACVLLYNVQTGDFFSFPTIYEPYSAISLVGLYLRDMNLFQNYAESSTSVAIQYYSAYVFNATSISNLRHYPEILCICTTNNCNLNLASCAIGFNLSQVTTASTTTVPAANSGSGSGSTTSSSASEWIRFKKTKNN